MSNSASIQSLFTSTLDYIDGYSWSFGNLQLSYYIFLVLNYVIIGDKEGGKEGAICAWTVGSVWVSYLSIFLIWQSVAT